MAARVGMATLIQELRAACAAGTADYVLANVTYWNDDQLQAELDRTQRVYQFLELEIMPDYIDGEVQYFQFGIPQMLGSYFEQDGVNSGWAVKNSLGEVVSSSDYVADYQAGRITFTADQKGSVFFLDARVYNLNRAAANVWRWKASKVANRVDWSSDNHKISGSMERAQALEMAKYYSGIAGPVTSVFFRTDEA
jgi:hypothetical protein